MMQAASRTGGVAILAAVALLAGCQEESPSSAAAPPAETPKTTEPAGADPIPGAQDTPTDDAVEEIRQGAEGELAEGTVEEPGSGLASLPGYTPPAGGPTSEADLRHTPALPVTANTPDDSPILITVTTIDVTDASEGALTPLEHFLSADDSRALDAEEVEGLYELLGTLRDADEIAFLSSMRVLVLGGQTATIAVEEAVPSSIPGVDAARDEMSVELAPSLTAPVGEGPDAERFVRLGMDFRMSSEDSVWQVLADDLGLDVGPTTRVAGTAVVRSGETIYTARRLARGDASREVLILVRPQVMPQEFNK